MASESVSFTLVLKDLMSGPLGKMGSTGNQSFDRLEKGADGFNKELDKTQAKSKGLNGTLASLKRSALTLIGTYAGFSAVKGIANLGMQAEQTEIAFSTMLQSVEKGKAMIAGLDQFANATPFENADLKENAKMLLNFGSSAESVIPTLQMLGDVSMGNRDKMNSLTLAFAQVQSTGKLMGQDLLQMINAGFNPLMEMSKMTGKSMGELKEDMSKGAISADMVTRAFQHATEEGGMFHNMMQKQSESTGGKLSTLIGKAGLLGEKIGLAMNPAISFFLDFGIAVLDSDSALSNIAVTLGIAGAAYGAYKLQALMATAASGAFTFSLKGIGMAIRSIPIVGWIAAAAEGLFLLYQHSETFRGGVLGIWEVIKEMTGMFSNLFTDFSGTLSRIGNLIAGFFKRQIAPVFEIIEAVRNGNWAKAAKAGGQLLLNFAGGGIGGLIQEVAKSDAFKTGQENAKNGGGTFNLFGGGESSSNGSGSGVPGLDSFAAAASSASAKSTSIGNTSGRVSGSGSGRPLTIHIGKLFEDQVINVSGDLKDNYNQIREAVNRALVDAVRDFELSYE
jgi:tape measure domain-containing protein